MVAGSGIGVNQREACQGELLQYRKLKALKRLHDATKANEELQISLSPNHQSVIGRRLRHGFLAMFGKAPQEMARFTVSLMLDDPEDDAQMEE